MGTWLEKKVESFGRLAFGKLSNRVSVWRETEAEKAGFGGTERKGKLF